MVKSSTSLPVGALPRPRPAAVLLALLVLAWAVPASSARRASSPSRAELAAMFSPGGDLQARLLAAYDAGGAGAAVQMYRRLRGAQPPVPYWRVGPEERSLEQLKAEAEVVMGAGFTYGGHPRFPLRPPVSWAADPYSDRSWCFGLNGWEPLEVVLSAYAATHDPRDLHFGVLVAEDWLRQHREAKLQNPFAWYDMAVGLRSLRLAYLTDAALRDPAISAEEVWLLLRGCREHGLELEKPETFNRRGNHGLYQAAGLLALAKAFPEFAESARWCTLADARLRTMLTRFFSPEGVYLEHSSAYQLWMVRLLLSLLDTGLSGDAELSALAGRAEDALAWMVLPDDTLSRIGDGDRYVLTPAALGDTLAARSPELLYVLSHGKEGRPPARPYRLFPKGGWAAFRSPWDPARPWGQGSYLALSAAFHSRTHKHADDLTFEWYDAGRPLVVDAGRYGYYYQTPERRYCESTRAHNTVEIDGKDTSRLPADAFGSALRDGGEGQGAFFVRAALTRRDPELSHQRTLVFKPGEWLVVVDELSGTQAHQYTQWFHFAADLPLERTGTLARLALGRGKSLYVLPLLAGQGVEATAVKGQKDPSLQGWLSYRPRQLEPAWALGYAQRGPSAVFATLLLLGKDPPSVTPDLKAVISAETLHLSWSLGGEVHSFTLRRGEGKRHELLLTAGR